MQNLPAAPDPGNLSPSTDDLYSDQFVQVQDADAFPDDRLTEAELDALYIAHMEAINEPACVCHQLDTYAPLPVLTPITSKVRKIDLSKFGGAA